MREIKFEYILDNHNSGTFKQIFTLEEMEETQNLFYNYPVIVRRQYTGLKDKNGKEIYFDDIIQHQEYLYQVVWNVDKIGFIQIKATITDFTIYADGGECLKSNYGRYFERKNLFNFDSCEIIGNIYENPDLMASIANNNI